MSSCISSLYAYETVYPNTDEIGVVLQLGTPYYFEGRLLYYQYQGMYYYPYLVRNRYYYYRYAEPLPPLPPGRIFVPGRRERPMGYIDIPRRNRPVIPEVRNRRDVPPVDVRRGSQHENRIVVTPQTNQRQPNVTVPQRTNPAVPQTTRPTAPQTTRSVTPQTSTRISVPQAQRPVTPQRTTPRVGGGRN